MKEANVRMALARREFLMGFSAAVAAGCPQEVTSRKAAQAGKIRLRKLNFIVILFKVLMMRLSFRQK